MKHYAESPKPIENSTTLGEKPTKLTENPASVCENTDQLIINGELKPCEFQRNFVNIDEKPGATFQKSISSTDVRTKGIDSPSETSAAFTEKPAQPFENPSNFHVNPLISPYYGNHVTSYGNHAFTIGNYSHGSAVPTRYELPLICTCAWRPGGDFAGSTPFVPPSIPVPSSFVNGFLQDKNTGYSKNEKNAPVNTNLESTQCSMGNTKTDTPREIPSSTLAHAPQRQEDKSSLMSVKNGRRSRKLFTSAQLAALESMFAQYQYIAAEQRKLLANRIGMSEVQVRVWFQNRRIKWRKEMQERVFLNKK